MRTLVDPRELAELRKDAARVAFLETLNSRKVSTGKVVLRDSLRARGWRLHEVGEGLIGHYEAIHGVTPQPTVRQAIDEAIRRANDSGLDPLKGDRP